ncbi:MAG: FmdB family zinc ribbon protein, partial [Candidatus Hinthialibacter sp.]
MPTYDYVCDKCGYEFEYFQSMTDPVLTECPQCKNKNCVRRLIGCGAGIIFKGSGFYETDYKRNSSAGG